MWMDSQKDTSDNKHDPCLAKVINEKTEVITAGLNNQKEASSTQQTSGPVEYML